MTNTAKSWTQDTPVANSIVSLGAPEFSSPTLANTALTLVASGKLAYLIPASATTNLFKAIDQIFRNLSYASISSGMTAFGTTGPPPVPGPSTVANTSGPRGIIVSPPIPKAQLPTITGPNFGPLPKGIQINSVDFIYQVLGAGATSISVGLTQTSFGAAGAGAVAPTVTNIITLGANGMPLTVAANPVTTRVAITNPVMLSALEAQYLLQFQAVAPAGCTIDFYGAVLNISYNYN